MTLPHPQAVWDSLGMRLFPSLLERYRSVQVNPLVAFCTFIRRLLWNMNLLELCTKPGGGEDSLETKLSWMI